MFHAFSKKGSSSSTICVGAHPGRTPSLQGTTSFVCQLSNRPGGAVFFGGGFD